MNKILVIGDSCLDEYIYCTTDRFCPDAPVPILKPESFVSALGMAGNVVDNLKALDCDGWLVSNANHIKKTRYVDSRTNHMFIRVDEGEDDVFPIAKKSLEDIENPITVSIIGCVVNGPGEANMTNIGITGGGNNTHMVYVDGNKDHIVRDKDLAPYLEDIIRKKAENNSIDK